jgi:Flp pilus assembly protein TadG
VRLFTGRLLRDRRRSKRGQSLTEFALILPVFLVIVLIGIDFGRAYQGWVHLQQAARIGANYVSTTPDWTQTELNTRIANDAGLTSDCVGAKSSTTGWFTAVVSTPGGHTTASSKVAVQCQFKMVTPIGTILSWATRSSSSQSSTFNLTADAVFPDRDVAVPDAVTTTPEPSPVKPTLSCFPTSGTVSLTTTCQGNFTGPVASYSWSWGDGSLAQATCSNASPATDGYCLQSHTYSSVNTFNVLFTITNLSGSATSDPRSITVNSAVPDPQITTFSCSPSCTTGSSSLFVTFNIAASSVGGNTPLSCVLSFGDGSANYSGACSNQTHIYSTGSRTATLTVTNSVNSTATSSLSICVGVSCLTATSLAYTGPTSATKSVAFTVSANLTVTSSGAPISGQTVSFSLTKSGQTTVTCSGATDAVGHASCSVTLGAKGTWNLTATFTATSTYAGSQATSTVAVN